MNLLSFVGGRFSLYFFVYMVVDKFNMDALLTECTKEESVIMFFG
jgi:hypothetical protein